MSQSLCLLLHLRLSQQVDLVIQRLHKGSLVEEGKELFHRHSVMMTKIKKCSTSNSMLSDESTPAKRRRVSTSGLMEDTADMNTFKTFRKDCSEFGWTIG
eukprot:m.261550 g.261550  ORF g.261550 m.261550 type:complete len:100 (+) comp40447_c1_seq59:2787-3086(+)